MAYETTDQLLAEFSSHWYKDHSGNLFQLLDSYNSHLEQMSDTAQQIAKWRGIQDAGGTTLDLFGQDIELYRPTKEDIPYRFFIYLKSLLSRAQGTVPSIVKIVSAALGTQQGIKVWRTGVRHVAMRVPISYVSDSQMQNFLLNNLQNMLGLGYWIDQIAFVATTNAQLYVGAETTDAGRDEETNTAVWWTGWRTKISNYWSFGVKTHYLEESIDRLKSS